MKIFALYCLCALTVLGLTSSVASKADGWNFQNGGYTTDPNTLPGELGYGIGYNDTSCQASVSGTGSFTLNYYTSLYWDGSGEPDYPASVTGEVQVNGSASPGSYAASTSTIPLPYANVGGFSFGFGGYMPPTEAQTTPGLFAQQLTAQLWCSGSGTSAHGAYAFAYFSF